MSFTQEQLDQLNSLLNQHSESLVNTFNEKLNTTVNGVSAKLTKQMEAKFSAIESSPEPTEKPQEGGDVKERLTLTKLQKELEDVRTQLAAKEQKQIETLKKAAISKVAGKALDATAYETLFRAEYGDKLIIDGDEVYVQLDENTVITVEDAAAKFETEGKGKFVVAPTVPTVTNAAPTPQEGAQGELLSEQQQLQHFMELINTPVI